VRTLLTHQQPPPTFVQVRDALTLEELTRGHHTPASTTPSSSTSRALVAAPPPSSASPPASLLGAPPLGLSEGGGPWGRRGRGGGGRGTPTQAPTPPLAPLPGGAPWPTVSHPWSGRISMWPYQGQGGRPRPTHQLAAMVTSAASYAPTGTPPPPPSSSWPRGWDQAALAQSFSTMGLTPPVGTEWITDSGAPYHTTPDAGILSSLRPHHRSCPSCIMVGDGSCLPVTSVGSAPGPFRLSDVLVAPQMVHNLLSIHQFTADNSCSVEFDTSGLSVKDLATGRPLLRCDSTGPLYTLRLPVSAASTSPSSSSSSAFAVTPSSTTWHRRLGHPGRDILAQISRSGDISCTRTTAEHLCQACQLGRHVRLPFYSSSSHVAHAFDLIHCDVWTRTVLSIGYKYYLVIIDDFSHYSWTFPLRAKSDTFPTFFTSLPGCPLSSASPLRPSSATTGVSLITPPLAPSSPAVSSSVCLVRILHHRTARQSA
jgi:hypothetical protein